MVSFHAIFQKPFITYDKSEFMVFLTIKAKKICVICISRLLATFYHVNKVVHKYVE